MTEKELIVKQQLEIEELKEKILEHRESCKAALRVLNHAEQWSIHCIEFPKVAMNAIVRARQAIEDYC